MVEGLNLIAIELFSDCLAGLNQYGLLDITVTDKLFGWYEIPNHHKLMLWERLKILEKEYLEDKK